MSPDEPTSNSPPTSTADRVWHYVIDDSPYGPTTRSALQEMANRNVIDAATLVWREGWDEWRAISDTDELAGIAQSPVFADDDNPQPRPDLQAPAARNETVQAVTELLLRRLAAAVIDQAIVFLPTMFLTAPAAAAVLGPNPTLAQMMQLGPADPKYWLLVLAVWLPHWAYASLMESSAHMGTIGKRVMHLRVTDRSGRRITFARASLRYWSKLASSFVFMLGYLFAAFTAGHRAMHDLIAGTIITPAPRTPSPRR